jgi:enoyl-CoA hydratase/carnithine racemase
MESTNVLIEKKDNVGILTINHSPANAVNLATLDDFNKALDDLEKDRDVRVVILTGAGEKGFSAGFDVWAKFRGGLILKKDGPLFIVKQTVVKSGMPSKTTPPS